MADHDSSLAEADMYLRSGNYLLATKYFLSFIVGEEKLDQPNARALIEGYSGLETALEGLPNQPGIRDNPLIIGLIQLATEHARQHKPRESN